MKKTYTQPAIELLSVELEQGIAMSTEEVTFSISTAAYEDVDW